MDNPFAKEYANQTGITPNTQSQDAASIQGNPFAQEYRSQTGTVPQAANPDDTAKALADTGDQSYNGQCQQFVEQMTVGHSGIFPSATDAWNTYQQSGFAKSGTAGIKPGDVLYFSPNDSNQGYGHTGIYMGGDKFVSATDNGVMPYSLSQWQKDTGQNVLGYVKHPQNLPEIGGQNGR